ncbi:MAG: TetR family transcriptional regulator [Nocardioides sp.]
MSAVPRGRRPGAPDTRTAILAAARTSFAEKGFAGTTIRAVAGAAGVDAALVHHYFGTKDDLFVAALELPVDPRTALAPALVHGPGDAGRRVLSVFVGVWDDPANTPVLVALARTLLDPSASHLMRDGFLPVVLQPVGRSLGLDHPDLRMALVASQLMGIILSRYVLELEPLASMPVETLVATYAPTLQRYLTGDLP